MSELHPASCVGATAKLSYVHERFDARAICKGSDSSLILIYRPSLVIWHVTFSSNRSRGRLGYGVLSLRRFTPWHPSRSRFIIICGALWALGGDSIIGNYLTNRFGYVGAVSRMLIDHKTNRKRLIMGA